MTRREMIKGALAASMPVPNLPGVLSPVVLQAIVANPKTMKGDCTHFWDRMSVDQMLDIMERNIYTRPIEGEVKIAAQWFTTKEHPAC